MPRHGVARQGAFVLSRLDGRGFAAKFVPGDEARDAYPFDYEFSVAYRFAPLGLTCELQLVNRGRTPIPCIRCNMGPKFTDLLRMARDLSALPLDDPSNALPCLLNEWLRDPRWRHSADNRHS